MNPIPSTRAAIRLAFIVGLVLVAARFGQSQDPKESPEYGAAHLKAGFEPDPVTVRLDAGGEVQTEKGGVKAWVAKRPDVRVHYVAGKYAFSCYVESAADTALIVNLPDGTWVANDNASSGTINPLVKIGRPQSGQYDIWVGTIEGGNKVFPPATLFITERK